MLWTLFFIVVNQPIGDDLWAVGTLWTLWRGEDALLHTSISSVTRSVLCVDFIEDSCVCGHESDANLSSHEPFRPNHCFSSLLTLCFCFDCVNIWNILGGGLRCMLTLLGAQEETSHHCSTFIPPPPLVHWLHYFIQESLLSHFPSLFKKKGLKKKKRFHSRRHARSFNRWLCFILFYYKMSVQ